MLLGLLVSGFVVASFMLRILLMDPCIQVKSWISITLKLVLLLSCSMCPHENRCRFLEVWANLVTISCGWPSRWHCPKSEYNTFQNCSYYYWISIRGPRSENCGGGFRRRISFFKVILQQRAEFEAGSGVIEIYVASLDIESELPWLKKMVWNWRRTMFVWISFTLFMCEVAFALVFCKPAIFRGRRLKGVASYKKC